MRRWILHLEVEVEEKNTILDETKRRLRETMKKAQQEADEHSRLFSERGDALRSQVVQLTQNRAKLETV